MSKKLRSVLIILFVFLVLAVVAFVVRKNLPKKEEISKITPSARISNLEIANDVLKWVNGQKKQDGFYVMDKFCIGEKCESYQPDSAESWREEPFIIWGRFQNYKKTLSSLELKTIADEIDSLPKKMLQFNDWNCRLMGQIFQTSFDSLDDLTTRIKSGSFGLCAIGGYEGSVGPLIKNDTVVNETLKSLIGQNPIEGINESDKEKLKTDFNTNAALASDHAYKVIVGSGKFDKEAKTYFLNALYGYSLLEKPTVNQISLLGTAAIDLFKITLNPDYVTFADVLYNRAISLVNSSESPNLEDYGRLLFFGDAFYDFNNNPKYKTTNNQIINKMIEKGFDHQGFGYKYGKNAFHQIDDPTHFSTKWNGAILGLLSK